MYGSKNAIKDEKFPSIVTSVWIRYLLNRIRILISSKSVAFFLSFSTCQRSRVPSSLKIPIHIVISIAYVRAVCNVHTFGCVVASFPQQSSLLYDAFCNGRLKLRVSCDILFAWVAVVVVVVVVLLFLLLFLLLTCSLFVSLLIILSSIHICFFSLPLLLRRLQWIFQFHFSFNCVVVFIEY